MTTLMPRTLHGYKVQFRGVDTIYTTENSLYPLTKVMDEYEQPTVFASQEDALKAVSQDMKSSMHRDDVAIEDYNIVPATITLKVLS